jgi:hypothetical protein
MSNKIDVGISATDAGFTSTIKKVNDSTKTLDDSVKKVAGNVTASFGSMVKAGAALAVGFGAVKLAGAAFREVFEGFGEALDLGGELSDLSARTGETAGNLLILQGAFDNAGSSADKVGPSINKMQKFLDDAAQGAAKNTEVLGRLGVSMVELEGKTPTEQMQLLAERISAIQDPLQRGALAMAVFGKSGGELLPLFQNFSGEIENAKAQLGSMPGILDKSNASFDTISDNIEKAKTKFRDFAAGLLDRLAPALEFATTMLTRFDAAALGMKLGDILIGAGEGMKGFKAAIEAISLGDFSLAWDIAFTSIKLSAAESLNSIVANVKGLFAAIKTLISESGITIAIEALTMGVVNKISSGLRSVIAEFLSSIGKVEAAKEMMLLSKADEERAQNYFTTAKAGFSSLGDNIADAMEPMRKAYDDAVKSSGELIDTQKISAELAEKNAELAEKIAEAKKQESSTTKEIKNQVDMTVTKQDIIKSLAENIADYEEAILQAKKDGNKEREVELGKQKAYAEELKRSLELGLSMDDAIKNAKKAQADYVKEITGELKEQTAEMQKQLGLSQEMLNSINERKAKEEIDPGGRLEDKFAKEQAAGNISGMERVQRQIAKREDQAATDKLFREVTGKEDRAARQSTRDMAKELGLDVTGKSNKELRDMIKADLEKKKQEKDDPTKKGEKEAQKADKQTQQADALKDIVQKIHDLCAKIEPKLPQTALGY